MYADPANLGFDSSFNSDAYELPMPIHVWDPNSLTNLEPESQDYQIQPLPVSQNETADLIQAVSSPYTPGPSLMQNDLPLAIASYGFGNVSALIDQSRTASGVADPILPY